MPRHRRRAARGVAVRPSRLRRHRRTRQRNASRSAGAAHVPRLAGAPPRLFQTGWKAKPMAGARSSDPTPRQRRRIPPPPRRISALLAHYSRSCLGLRRAWRSQRLRRPPAAPGLDRASRTPSRRHFRTWRRLAWPPIRARSRPMSRKRRPGFSRLPPSRTSRPWCADCQGSAGGARGARRRTRRSILHSARRYSPAAGRTASRRRRSAMRMFCRRCRSPRAGTTAERFCASSSCGGPRQTRSWPQYWFATVRAAIAVDCQIVKNSSPPQIRDAVAAAKLDVEALFDGQPYDGLTTADFLSLAPGDRATAWRVLEGLARELSYYGDGTDWDAGVRIELGGATQLRTGGFRNQRPPVCAPALFRAAPSRRLRYSRQRTAGR